MKSTYSILLIFSLFSVSAFSQTFSLERSEDKKVVFLTRLLNESLDLEPKELRFALNSMAALTSLDSHIGVLNEQNFTHKDAKSSLMRVLYRLNVRQLNLLLKMQTLIEAKHNKKLEDQYSDHLVDDETLEDINTFSWSKGVKILYRRQVISSIIDIKMSTSCKNLLSSNT
jgi:hypothetical protein